MKPLANYFRQLREVDPRGCLYLPEKYARRIGARCGDRLRVKVSPGKVTLTLAPKTMPHAKAQRRKGGNQKP